jgi:tRNA dimethylallyltransferase
MTGPHKAATSKPDGRRDIVAVIGTTGVGKSQLAVDLAQHVQSKSLRGLDDAIILSSDSMQLYEGLPLITNQVTEEESGGIEHWGINVVRPGQGGPWEVGKWCNEALEKVRACRMIYTGKPMKFDVHVVP